MYFDTKEFKKKVKDLTKDVENLELKAPAWIWVLGGSLFGLVSSCVRLRRESGKPIIASLKKVDPTEEKE